jgi:type IV secretory pathway VirB10-like protein
MMYAQMPLRLRRSSFATNRVFIVAIFLAVLILAVLTFTMPSRAQEPAQSGVSHPPEHEVYEPSDGPGASIPEPASKPSPTHYDSTPASQPESVQSTSVDAPVAETAPPVQAAQPVAQPSRQIAAQPAAQPAAQSQDPDGMIVGDMPIASSQPAQNQNPQLSERPSESSQVSSASDPDGDIVHPRAPQPGEIIEGTTIRIRLIDRLSSASSGKGTVFKGRVASDVLSNGQVLIPTGSEIDGQVVQVSSGDHLGAKGFMRLRPEILILPDGASYRITSVVSGTPGSNTKVNQEGTVKAGSRNRRAGIEYGVAVTGGVVTGAILGGPVGAVTGGAVGAGLVTTHLLVNHAQAVLEPGTVLLITLTNPLELNTDAIAQTAPVGAPATN